MAGARTTRCSSSPIADRQHHEDQVGQPAGSGPRLSVPAPLGGWKTSVGDQRHGQQHQQHPQVLHDGDHPVVGAELAGPARRSRRRPRRSARRRRWRGRRRGRSASSRPAARLIASVPTVTSSTEGQSEASRARVGSFTSAPMTAPTSAWPIRNASGGMSSSVARGQRVQHAADQGAEQHRGGQVQGREQQAGDARSRRARRARRAAGGRRSHRAQRRGDEAVVECASNRETRISSGAPTSVRMDLVGGEYSFATVSSSRSPAPRPVPVPLVRVRRAEETSGTCSIARRRAARRRTPERSVCGRSHLGLVDHDHRHVSVLLFDVIIIGRRPHEPSMKEVSIAPGAVRRAGRAVRHRASGCSPATSTAREFFAGWLTEYSLSVDNLFIFIIIMAKFAVPRKYQQEALMVGIVLALVMRGDLHRASAPRRSTSSAGSSTSSALFLVYTAVKLAKEGAERRRRVRGEPADQVGRDAPAGHRPSGTASSCSPRRTASG